MQKRILTNVLLVCLGVLGATAVAAQAQETMMTPPKVLVIAREDVKPGKGSTHEKVEASWVRAFSQAKTGNHYIAVTSMTGPNVALFFEIHDSFAEWEKANQAIESNAALTAQIDPIAEKDGDLLSETRGSVAIYEPDLSYNTDVTVKGTRYFVILMQRVKPGHGEQYEAVRKAILAAHQKANVPEHYAVYHVLIGAASGTYLTFIPLKSLSELDQYSQIHGKAYHEALGKDAEKLIEDFDREGLTASEVNIYALSPKMSYPPKEWIAADTEFWAPKPKAAAKPAAAKKEAAKPAGQQ
jgi:hypothetical protein